MGDFKGDRRELGLNLERSRESGLTGIQRRYVALAPEGPVRVVKEVRPQPGGLQQLTEAPAVGAGRPGPKGGRPGHGEPWKGEGISRAAWFRRRKGEG
jgi:hypothetical protein